MVIELDNTGNMKKLHKHRCCIISEDIILLDNGDQYKFGARVDLGRRYRGETVLVQTMEKLPEKSTINFTLAFGAANWASPDFPVYIENGLIIWDY